MNKQEFINAIYPTRKSCLDLIAKSRWEDSIHCTECGSKNLRIFRHEKEKTQTYKCIECNNVFSVLTDTIFENSKTPLQRWFYAIFLIYRNDKITCRELAEQAGTNKDTANAIKIAVDKFQKKEPYFYDRLLDNIKRI